MNPNIKATILILVIVFSDAVYVSLSHAYTSQISSRQNEAESQRSVIIDKFESLNSSILEVADELQLRGIRVFAERIGTPPDTINVRFERTTVQTLLETLCREQSYAYKEYDGSINLIPQAALELHDRYPLNRLISKFEVNDETALGAFRALQKLAGSDLFLIRETRQITTTRKSVVLEGVTVREALNKIVEIWGLASWMGSVAQEEGARNLANQKWISVFVDLH